LLFGANFGITSAGFLIVTNDDFKAHGACFLTGDPHNHVPVRVEAAACERNGSESQYFAEAAA